MRKFLKKTCIYICLVFIIGNIFAFTAEYFLGKSHFYKNTYLVNAFKKGHKFDYFITGSSRGLTTLNSTLIDKELDLEGVNLSMDDTDLKTHKLMINHFFKSGFKSKYCVLALDATHFIKTDKKLGNNDYRFITFSDKDYVRNHYKKYEEDKLKMLSNSKYFPLFAYSYYNLELFATSVLSMLKPKYRNRFDEKGNYTYPNSRFNKRDREIEVENLNIVNPILKDINDVLKRNNSKLLIYIAPYKNKNYINSRDKLNLKVINHSGVIKNDSLFFDNIHVNKDGRVKATNLFIKDFKNIILTKGL